MEGGTHRFCWYGVVSTDPDRAATFFSKVLGWKAVDIRIGHGATPAFEVGGAPFAHLKKAPPGMSSHWECYLRVDRVDGRASLVEMNGGRIILPPTDTPVGRISVVASPSGARLCLIREGDELLGHPGGLGGIEWVDLHSSDLETDLAWLTSAFRFELGPRAPGSYAYLNYKGEPRAGATQAYVPGLRPSWLVWVSVRDLDDVVRAVEKNDGRVVRGPDGADGNRWSVVADSTGTVLGLLERKGEARE